MKYFLELGLTIFDRNVVLHKGHFFFSYSELKILTSVNFLGPKFYSQPFIFLNFGNFLVLNASVNLLDLVL